MTPNSFASFDEFAESLGHSDLRLSILGRERLPWATCSCLLDGVRVRWARDGGPSMFEAALNPGSVGFLIGLNAAGKMTGNSVMFGSDSVLVVPGGVEFHAVSLDTVTWGSVVIPASRIKTHIEGGRQAGLVSATLIETSAVDGGLFCQTLRRVIASALTGAFEENPLGQAEAAQELVSTVQNLLGTTPESKHEARLPGRHPIPRGEILRRVHAMFEQYEGEPVALSRLAEAAGVSDRTLRNVFEEQFGMNPKRFLRVRTLNAARRELLRADPKLIRVTDVTTKLGIWEWGRFSRDYYALFGELPSETLRRKKV